MKIAALVLFLLAMLQCVARAEPSPPAEGMATATQRSGDRAAAIVYARKLAVVDALKRCQTVRCGANLCTHAMITSFNAICSPASSTGATCTVSVFGHCAFAAGS